MPLGKWYGRDLDEVFAYEVPRTVRIKDGVIGAIHYAVVLAAGVALLVQIFALDKGYYKTGAVVGVTRVQPQAPYAEWTSAALGAPLPYCSNASTNQPPAVNGAGGYALLPATAAAPHGQYALWGNVTASRFPCLTLDAKYEVTNPLDASVFLPTRIVTYAEAAPACSTAASATHVAPDGRTVLNTTATECTFAATAPAQSWYIPDVEAYTLLIQHSVTVPLLDSSWTKDQMVSGIIAGHDGSPVDACAFYRRRNPAAACPLNPSLPVASSSQYISLGTQNVPDIVSVGTLLEAAGVPSLDVTGSPATDTLRYGGLTLVVSINYDNFFDPSPLGYKNMRYTMSVNAVYGKVKGIFGTSSTGALPATPRWVAEKSGLRIIFTAVGRVGKADWQTGFMSVMAITQSFAIAALATAFVIGSLLKLSPIYTRYIRATTHALPELRTREDLERALALFSDEYVLNPPPPALLKLDTALGRAPAPASAACAPGTADAPADTPAGAPDGANAGAPAQTARSSIAAEAPAGESALAVRTPSPAGSPAVSAAASWAAATERLRKGGVLPPP